MSRPKFLPSFTTAPGPNRRLVCDPTSTHPIVFDVEHPTEVNVHMAENRLKRARDLARRIASLANSIQPNQEKQQTHTWATLRETTIRRLDTHLQRVEFPSYPGYTEADVRDRSAMALREGVAFDVAFLELTGKVLFRHEFADPNAEIAGWARSSVGFMIEWAGLDGEIDYEVVWALATPKPQKVQYVFEDLILNPRWFAADDGTQRIGLDPNKVANLRDSNNDPPQYQRNPREALFACPAAPYIPKLHQTLVNQAEESGLFGQTYLSERANHGYEEAWLALGALTNQNK